MKIGVLPTLVFGLLPAFAQAQSLTLVERETVMDAFFLVGYSTLVDRNTLSNHDSTLVSSFSELLQDAGAVDGMVGSTPVQGSARFTSSQTFEVGAAGISAVGRAQAEAAVGYGYVSAGASAVSTVKLSFSVDSVTPFTLWGSLLVGGLRSLASVALTPLTAPSSNYWRFDTTGDFAASGTLLPGTWQLYASANASANPGNFRLSDFGVNLQLAPVPEPSSLGLLLAGLGAVGWRLRRRAGPWRGFILALATVPGLAPALLLTPATALAQGIGQISTVNESDADDTYTGGNASFEFRTQATSTAPVFDGQVASFSHRMAWFAGLHSTPSSTFATSASEVPDVAFLLRFTVFDPRRTGYTLQLQGRLAGALWAGTDGTATAIAALRPFAVGVDDSGDVGPSFVDLRGLATTGRDAVVAAPASFEDRLVDERGRETAGDFVGTLDFVLAVRADPQWLATTVPIDGEAQSYLQFGMAPTLPALFGGFYTGPTAPALDDLGYFLDVSAEFRRPPPVPEPAPAAALLAGLLVLAACRRRP